jgi:hypothetical protein
LELALWAKGEQQAELRRQQKRRRTSGMIGKVARLGDAREGVLACQQLDVHAGS